MYAGIHFSNCPAAELAGMDDFDAAEADEEDEEAVQVLKEKGAVFVRDY